jgi:uncharacterized protein
VKLSFKELTIDGGSFEGAFRFDTEDLQVEISEFNADFLPTDAGLYLDLRFKYSFTGECDKCLGKTSGEGEGRTGVQIVKLTEEDKFKDEAELGEDDMGISYITEDQIDLHEMVRQEVELELPVKVICKDDCKGLCPQCGENLNEGSCGCNVITDPRWSALNKLKDS